MTEAAPAVIRSAGNALLKDLRRLAQDSHAHRRQQRVWLEGDHLCRAALARGLRPALAVFSESFWPLAGAQLAQAAPKTIVIDDALWRGISGLESPAPLGFVLDLPEAAELAPGAPTVVLDRVQDAGNVGAILQRGGVRFHAGGAVSGTALLWSPRCCAPAWARTSGCGW